MRSPFKFMIAISTFNLILALGSIALGLLGVFLIIDIYSKRELEAILRQQNLTIAFAVTFFGSVAALIYSEVYNFPPCSLCWFQRVFLFAQVPLLAVALYEKNTRVALTGMVFSVSGLIFSLYQHYLQMGGKGACPTSGPGIDCAERFFYEFGFLTFPLMSALVFFFLFSLYFYSHKLEKIIER